VRKKTEGPPRLSGGGPSKTLTYRDKFPYLISPPDARIVPSMRQSL